MHAIVPRRVLVTGATGYLGRMLLPHLVEPVVLSRDPERARRELGQLELHAWDPESGLPPAEAFEGVEAILHLAGEPIAMRGRWTPEKKARIRRSRVEGTRHLVERLAQLESRPRTLVTASAIGLYGPGGDALLTEETAPAAGFWPEVCRDWEAAAGEARALGMRVVPVRMGLVFGERGGFLEKTLGQFRAGFGGPIGDGQQWMSWIHSDDLVRVFLHALSTPELDGALNATAPEPLRNEVFAKILARLLYRPALLRMPQRLVEALLGEVTEALLISQRVLPGRLLASGFEFHYPDAATALGAVVCPNRRAA